MVHSQELPADLQSDLNPADLNHRAEPLDPDYLAPTTFKRRCYLAAGFLSMGVGILGIVLPLLDTTPFMLLAAFCFARSSKKWHQWLLNHPIFGEFILAFQEKRGLTLTQKRRIGLVLTLMMSLSVMHGPFPLMLWVTGIVLIIGFSILIFSKTAKKKATVLEGK